jgi:hypothetical protein
LCGRGGCFLRNAHQWNFLYQDELLEVNLCAYIRINIFIIRKSLLLIFWWTKTDDNRCIGWLMACGG